MIDMVSGSEAAAYWLGSSIYERSRWFVDQMRERLPNLTRVVELGAGGLASHLGGVCIEDDHELARTAACRTVLARGEKLPLASHAVPLLVTSSTRVLGRPGAMAEVARVLTDDGVLLCFLPQPTPGSTDTIRAILGPMRRNLRRSPPGAVREDLVAEASAAGLLCRVEALDPHPYQQTPRQEAQDLRQAASSVLWSVSEESWRRHIAPAIRALERLPAPDMPRTRYAYWDLLTFAPSLTEQT